MPHDRIKSGAPWESLVGYSRAVRAGSSVSVAGTTAVGEDGNLTGIGDPYAQARRCLEIILAALAEVDGKAEDVVRTRIYVTDIGHWREVARAHAEVFSHARPATTMVEVSRLIDPEMLVEIEADAILSTAGVPPSNQ